MLLVGFDRSAIRLAEAHQQHALVRWQEFRQLDHRLLDMSSWDALHFRYVGIHPGPKGVHKCSQIVQLGMCALVRVYIAARY
jgi:hypothetical protein